MPENPTSNKQFPTVLKYLDDTVGGILSHPECAAVGGYCNIIRRRYPEAFSDPNLAIPVRLKVQRGWADSDWINATLQVAMVLALYDYFGRSEETTEEALSSCFAEMCQQPTYWVLMKVLSPALVVLGTDRKWHYFFKGCFLQGKHQKGNSVLRMTFPENLFPQLYCKLFRVMFVVIVKAAGSKSSTCELTQWTATEATYKLSW